MELTHMTVITIPPTGLRGKSLTSLICALIILLVFGGFATACIFGLQEHPSPFGSILAIAVVTIATIVPLSLLLVSFQLARRRVACSISQAGLDVEWQGPILRSRRHFDPGIVRGFGATQAPSAADGKLLDNLVLYLNTGEHNLLSLKSPSILPALAEQLSAACVWLHQPPGSGLANQFPIPPSARVQIVEDDSSITLFFPARGLRGGLLLGALVALAFIIFSLLMGAAFIVNNFIDLKLGNVQPGSFVIFAIESVIGPVALAALFHESRRRMILILGPTALVFRSQGPFRTRESAWPRQHLLAAAVTTTSKDRSDHTIHLKTPDSKIHLLMERPDLAELQWIATVINHWSGQMPASNTPR
jgi:hypothetical protein